jgi:quercetin dioxygenase-like cupin family protein
MKDPEEGMEEAFFKNSEARIDVVDPGMVSRKVLARGGKMMMVEVSFAEGGIGTRHTHPHEQSTYCLEGEFVFTVREDSRILLPGDTVFIPSGVGHDTVAKKRGRLLDVFTPQREDFI